MNDIKKGISRRNFTKLSATALGAIPFMGYSSLKPKSNYNDAIQVHLFSKHLQFLDYNDMSAAAVEMGFDGLDLTVRPKGHVLPKNVVRDLPKAVEAMKKHGLKVQMMSTNVWDATDNLQKTVLKAASDMGITHYRTDWLKYPEERTISESQAIYAQQAKELEVLNKKLSLIGGYQNHAGNHVGAPIWDLLPILNATNNENFGVQYDIRHAVVEGGSCWELGLRQIQPYINSIVVKDFKWEQVDGQWKAVSVPMGKGMVDFNRYFSLLKKYKINVPISLHVEHDLGGAEHGATEISIDKKEVLKRIKYDLDFLKNAWKNA